MNLFILSAVHNITSYRKEIYKFFLERMRHLSREFNIDMLVVGSEGEASRWITEEAGFLYLEHENNPVSDKWNAGLQELEKYNPTHVMSIDSDDFISDSLLKCYITEIESGFDGIIGIMDSYFITLSPWSTDFNKCIYWHGYPSTNILGTCRCVPRRILDAVGWELWTDGENSGLGRASKIKMLNAGASSPVLGFSVKEEGWLHLDIKTKGNISSMSPLMKRSDPADFNELIRDHLTLYEANNIISYRDNIVSSYEAK
jgi:hypothetical protein